MGGGSVAFSHEFVGLRGLNFALRVPKSRETARGIAGETGTAWMERVGKPCGWGGGFGRDLRSTLGGTLGGDATEPDAGTRGV